MDLVKELAERLKRNNSVLLVAPTGWGKTTLMFRLAVQLAKEGWRVGILAPTLTLLVKKWPQFLELLKNEPNPPRIILTAGAGQYCVYQWNIPQRFCPRCRLYRNIDVQFGDFVTYEDIERLTPDDICGYWAQEAVLSRYNILLSHYGRLSKIIHLVHFLFIDEAHEFYLPHITSFPLAEIAQLLGVRAEELSSVAVVRELIEERLYNENDPQIEDRLWSLYNAVKKTCWIEDYELHCMDLYELPQRVRIFAATATPPPGWPPEGWGEKIEIKPPVKPKAFVEPEAKFYYKDRYEGAALMLHMIVNWLRREYNIEDIAVFATSSLRQVLQYSLPPGVELFLARG
jgi:hypothetical protein